MARFVGRPVLVEAYQHRSGALPALFVPAVRRHLPKGGIEINTDQGPRPCMPGEWIVAGPDGSFTVMSDAKFETHFQVYGPPAPAVETPVAAARAAKRKEKVYG